MTKNWPVAFGKYKGRNRCANCGKQLPLFGSWTLWGHGFDSQECAKTWDARWRVECPEWHGLPLPKRLREPGPG